MSSKIVANQDILRIIGSCPPKLRSAILKNVDDKVLTCICEFALNLCQNNIKVSPRKRRQLLPHKTAIRHLANKQKSATSKRKYIIQKGGIVSLLLSTVLPAVIPLLTNLLTKRRRKK